MTTNGPLSNKRANAINKKLSIDYIDPLKQSDYYKSSIVPVLEKLTEELDQRLIGQLVCYGLGSFHDGHEKSSRYQLALLILIHLKLADLGHPVHDVIEIFDPGFNEIDKEVLRRRFEKPRFRIIEQNEFCARELSDLSETSTLVFMPHLDKLFYNNLLGVNWSLKKLTKLVVFGNSFDDMIVNDTFQNSMTSLYYISMLVFNFEEISSQSHKLSPNPRKKKRKAQGNVAKTIDLVGRALIELRIDDKPFHMSGVFNNLSFHLLDEHWLAKNAERVDATRLKDWATTNRCDEPNDWHEME